MDRDPCFDAADQVGHDDRIDDAVAVAREFSLQAYEVPVLLLAVGAVAALVAGQWLSLGVIAAVRALLGETAFADWGWRIPFLLSAALLGVSVWVRLSLDESPIFQKMKDEGRLSKSPLREAYGQWRYLKRAFAALFGIIAGQATLWYASQFYSLYFAMTGLHALHVHKYVDLMDPARSPVLSIKGQTEVGGRQPMQGPPLTRLVMPLDRVVFPVEGTYEFVLDINGQRVIVQTLGGDCHSPIGALAEIVNGDMRLRVAIGSLAPGATAAPELAVESRAQLPLRVTIGSAAAAPSGVRPVTAAMNRSHCRSGSGPARSRNGVPSWSLTRCRLRCGSS